MIAKLLLTLTVASASVAVIDAQLLQAIAYLQGPNPYVRGNITLSQSDKGPVAIWGKITGLTPGKHGFHIHEKGDITGGCGATGGHYNPYKKPHGSPLDGDRHVGDLGNINAAPDGVSLVSITDKQISLSGPYSILGRSIVVHSDVDDFGKGGQTDSLTTGHAGSRVVCGVIGVLTPLEKWEENSSSTTVTAVASLVLTAVAVLRLYH